MIRIYLTKAQRGLLDIDDDQWRLEMGLQIDGLHIVGDATAMKRLAGAYEDRADPDAGFDHPSNVRAIAKRAAKRIVSEMAQQSPPTKSIGRG